MFPSKFNSAEFLSVATNKKKKFRQTKRWRFKVVLLELTDYSTLVVEQGPWSNLREYEKRKTRTGVPESQCYGL